MAGEWSASVALTAKHGALVYDRILHAALSYSDTGDDVADRRTRMAWVGGIRSLSG